MMSLSEAQVLRGTASSRTRQRAMRGFGWSAGVTLLAAFVGAVPALIRAPETVFYATLLTGQATVLGFLIIVATFIYEQQRSAVEAALENRDGIRWLIISNFLLCVIVSLAGAMVSLTMLSSGAPRRIHGAVAGGLSAGGLALGLFAIVAVIRSLSAGVATDRLVARAMGSARARSGSIRRRPRGSDQGSARDPEWAVERLGHLALLDAAESSLSAFERRIEGLRELHRELPGLRRRRSDEERSDLLHPVVDELFRITEHVLPRRDFATCSLRALEAGLESARSREEAEKAVDRLIGLLRRIPTPVGLSARVVRAIVRAPLELGSGEHRDSTRPLISAGLRKALSDDAPRDVAEAVGDGVRDLLVAGATDVVALREAVMELDASVRPSAAALVIDAVHRSTGGDTLPALSGDPGAQSGFAALIMMVTDLPEARETAVKVLSEVREPVAVWLRSLPSPEREVLLARWLAQDHTGVMLTPEGAYEEAVLTFDGLVTPSSIRATRLGAVLAGVVLGDGTQPEGFDWGRFADEVLGAMSGSIDDCDGALGPALLLRERLHLLIEKALPTTQESRLSDALFLAASADRLDAEWRRWADDRPDATPEQRSDRGAWLRELYPRLFWSGTDVRAGRQGLVEPNAAIIAEALGPLCRPDADAGRLTGDMAAAMATLVALDLLERDAGSVALNVFVRVVSALGQGAVSAVRDAEPHLDHRLARVTRRLQSRTPEEGEEPLLQTLVRSACLRLSSRGIGLGDAALDAAAAIVALVETRGPSAVRSTSSRIVVDSSWSLFPPEVLHEAALLVSDGREVDHLRARSLADGLLKLPLLEKDEARSAALHGLWLALRSAQIREVGLRSRLQSPSPSERSFLASLERPEEGHGRSTQRIGVVHPAKMMPSGHLPVDVGDETLRLAFDGTGMLKGGEVVLVERMPPRDETPDADHILHRVVQGPLSRPDIRLWLRRLHGVGEGSKPPDDRDT